MRRVHGLASVLAVTALLAGCGASGGATPDASAPTTAPTATAAAEPTASPTRAPTPVPSQAGPVVLASTLYPYRLTVPPGPTSFVPAPVRWDGAQKLSTDTRVTDRARVPGASTIFLAMTDTAATFDVAAADIEAKFRSWHACKPATGRREFAVGELQGVGFVHPLCGGGDSYVRAVVVGDGHMLVAFSPAGTDPTADLDGLIDVLGGLAWTG